MLTNGFLTRHICEVLSSNFLPSAELMCCRYFRRAQASHSAEYRDASQQNGREDLMKPAGFFSPPQKQSCHPVFETLWRPGPPASMDGYNQPKGRWHSFEVLRMVKFAFYYCRKHKSLNSEAVHTCRLHRTLLTAVPRRVSQATRLRRGEFQVKTSLFPRFDL